MKGKQILFCIGSLILQLVTTIAAAQKNTRPLEIGDKIPEVVLQKVLNYSQKHIKLSQLRGRLVILDFWNKGCNTCIANFPKMEELQKEFGNKIQVLLVTSDKESELSKLFQLPIVKKVNLPFVVEDKILSDYFPYTGVPFHVWIDEEGKVRAMTSHYHATKNNIAAYFATGRLHLPLRTHYKDFNSRESLLKEGNGRQLPNLKYYSLIMNHISGYYGVTQGINRDAVGNLVGLKATNNSILGLYAMAYKISLFDRSTMLQLSVNRPEVFYYPKQKTEVDEWQEKNTFCYESMMPEEKIDQRFLLMQQDLDRFFDLESRLEIKTVKCLALIRKDSIDKLKTMGGEEFYQHKDELVLRNMPLSLFIRRMNLLNFGTDALKIVDETGYTSHVDLQISGDLADLNNVRTQLSNYHLDLVAVERVMNVLIISEKTFQ